MVQTVKACEGGVRPEAKTVFFIPVGDDVRAGASAPKERSHHTPRLLHDTQPFNIVRERPALAL
jgi:hypothetical protein